MRRLLLIAVPLLWLLPAMAPALAEELDADGLSRALDGDRADRAEAVDYILEHPRGRTALEMLVGAARAVQLERTEDAGFLFYAGQMRARLELDAYKAEQEGPGGPEATVNQLSHDLGRAIHPTVLQDPELLRAVVERLEEWPAEPREGHRPAWPVQGDALPDKAGEMAREIKRSRLEVLQDYLVASRDEDWAGALEDIRAHNALSEEEREKPEAEERLADAQQRIERAEDRLDVCLLGPGCNKADKVREP